MFSSELDYVGAEASSHSAGKREGKAECSLFGLSYPNSLLSHLSACREWKVLRLHGCRCLKQAMWFHVFWWSLKW